MFLLWLAYYCSYYTFQPCAKHFHAQFDLYEMNLFLSFESWCVCLICVGIFTQEGLLSCWKIWFQYSYMLAIGADFLGLGGECIQRAREKSQ